MWFYLRETKRYTVMCAWTEKTLVLPTECTILCLYSLLHVSAVNLGYLHGATSLFDVHSRDSRPKHVEAKTTNIKFCSKLVIQTLIYVI
jgi:hypothetical protein